MNEGVLCRGTLLIKSTLTMGQRTGPPRMHPAAVVSKNQPDGQQHPRHRPLPGLRPRTQLSDPPYPATRPASLPRHPELPPHPHSVPLHMLSLPPSHRFPRGPPGEPLPENSAPLSPSSERTCPSPPPTELAPLPLPAGGHPPLSPPCGSAGVCLRVWFPPWTGSSFRRGLTLSISRTQALGLQ